ncbi:MAG TPA: FKBP-type peptidyl-prolyl cis-trans isomerase [Chryseosolibacter sp.]|jgi:FKBP-type peptidyl-prolyl cis-trans isomerase|nr:FKBP-type peptidyl-prolyl cis-trans isomerase [Chryseosolibacter sp.]
MRKRFVKVAFGLLAVVPFVVGSCMMNENEDIPNFNEQLQKDLETIDNYLLANNIQAMQDPDGLIRYVMHADSSGTKPTIDSCVTANYKGLLLAGGQVFDTGENVSFPLKSVIDGWKIGIPLMNVGDSITLYIPSGLAYGYYGYPPEIPSNANLIFNVGLEKVGSSYNSSTRSCD